MTGGEKLGYCVIGAVVMLILFLLALALFESRDSDAVTQLENREWFQRRATVFTASDGTKCIAISGDFTGLACDFK